MTAKDIREAAKTLESTKLPDEYCWKCGKKAYMVLPSEEAAKDLRAAGFDGSCCFEWPS